jgi:hypothetical protein
MRFHILTRMTVFLGTCLAAGGILLAQSFPFLSSINQWSTKYLATMAADGSTLLLESLDQEKTVVRIQGPAKARGIYWLDDQGWCLVPKQQPEGDKVRRTLEVMCCGIDGKWKRIGMFDPQAAPWPGKSPEYLLPLDKQDRFIGFLSGGSAFEMDGKMSTTAIFRNIDGFMTCEQVLEYPLQEPFFQLKKVSLGPNKVVSVPRDNVKYSVVHSSLSSMPIVVGNFYAIIWRRAGYIWLFDRKSGVIRRNIKIYDGVTENSLGKSDEIDCAILGIQATRDGELLVAAREEFAVLHAMKHFDAVHTLEKANRPGGMEKIFENQQKALMANPLVIWLTVDPVTATVGPVPTPIGGPSQLLSLQLLQTFNFRFRPNNSLAFNFSEDLLFREESKGTQGN